MSDTLGRDPLMVEQLRVTAASFLKDGDAGTAYLMKDAAAEIERLRIDYDLAEQDNIRLRGANAPGWTVSDVQKEKVFSKVVVAPATEPKFLGTKVLSATTRPTATSSHEAYPWSRVIEHAGYLATAATHFIRASNVHNEACMNVEAAEEGVEDSPALDVAMAARDEASGSYCEAMRALLEAVYEFEKRRAKLTPESPHSEAPK